MDCMRACSAPLLRLVLTADKVRLSLCMHTHTHTTYTVHSVTALVDAAAFGLSDGAFLPTIQSQGTDEQREKWVPLIRDYGVIGAYAQTEMGHGKNERFLFVTVTVTVKVY